MNHPAEETMSKASKVAALKEKLAAARGASGGNGQSAPAVPGNGSNGYTTPAKKRGAVEAKQPKQPKAEAKAPAKKEPTAPKAPAKKEPKRRAAPQGGRHRTMDRDKEGDGLRPVERDIMKIVKQEKGKPISIRKIAIALHGENKVKAADKGDTKDNVLVRIVRNGIRKPREYGMLKLWTETGDPEAKSGYVVLGERTSPPAGAGTRAKRVAKKVARGSTPKAKAAPKEAKKEAKAPTKKTPAKKGGKA